MRFPERSDPDDGLHPEAVGAVRRAVYTFDKHATTCAGCRQGPATACRAGQLLIQTWTESLAVARFLPVGALWVMNKGNE